LAGFVVALERNQQIMKNIPNSNISLSLLLCAVTLHCLSLTGFAQTNLVLALDGTSGYVTVPSTTDLQTDEITIEAWIYPTQVPNDEFGSFINKGDGLTGNSQRTYEARWVPSNSLVFAFYFDVVSGLPDYASFPVPVFSNQWTHVAATFSSSAGYIQVFTNGVLAAWATNLNGTPIQGRGLRQTTLPLVFGWTPSFATTYASGYMDEIRVWNVARTQAEIAESRFCRLTGAEAGLTGYWNFDNGTAMDLSSNGNNGVLNGGANIIPIPGQDAVHEGICGAPYFEAASLTNLPGAGFLLTLDGPSGLNLQIDTSTNLVNWLPLFVLPNFSGRLEFIDPEASNFQQRFYRAVPQ
jgi:hypothetical protein